jgi:hypothetical protein
VSTKNKLGRVYVNKEGGYVRTWDEVRDELERRHGIKLSRARIWQIGIKAEAKLREALR